MVSRKTVSVFRVGTITWVALGILLKEPKNEEEVCCQRKMMY